LLSITAAVKLASVDRHHPAGIHVLTLYSDQLAGGLLHTHSDSTSFSAWTPPNKSNGANSTSRTRAAFILVCKGQHGKRQQIASQTTLISIELLI
jgi:hypothetical protein